MFKLIKRTLKYFIKKIDYRIDVSSLYTEVPRMVRKIPNRVYQTWVNPVFPYVHARALQRFRRLNPDYTFSFFDDQQMAHYMDSNFAGHPILELFHGDRMPSGKADIWRYCVLFREGGIYCDIDSTLAVPLRELVHEETSELISFENVKWADHLSLGRYADPDVFLPGPPNSIKSNLDYPEHTVINWLLGFEKGNPILEELINLIVRHAHFYKNKKFEDVSLAGNHFTGPLALTEAIWIWMQKSGKRPQQCGVDFLGKGIFKYGELDYRQSPHHSTRKNELFLD